MQENTFEMQIDKVSFVVETKNLDKGNASVEEKLKIIESALTEEQSQCQTGKNSRYLALHWLLDDSHSHLTKNGDSAGVCPREWDAIKKIVRKCREELAEKGLDYEKIAASVANPGGL